MIGVGTGADHVANSLRYCMIYTPQKYKLDPKPFFSPNFSIPKNILWESKNSLSKLKKKAADPEEIKEFLFNMPEISSWDELATSVDRAFERDPDSIPLSRLSQFLSKHGGRDGKKTVATILERRSQCKNMEEDKKTFKDYVVEAKMLKCECSPPYGYKKALIQTVKFHDSHEYSFKGSKKMIGDFAKAMCGGDFNDRSQTIHLHGVSGSGKSTVLNPFLNLLPPRRVFNPVYGSSAPWSHMRNYHLIGNYQEFRPDPLMRSNTLLLLLERAENAQLNVKGDAAVSVARGPRCIMTSNRFKPCQNWSEDDITAIFDRITTGTWTQKIPQEMRKKSAFNFLESKCKRCSVDFLSWCSPAMAKEINPNKAADAKKNDQPKEKNDEPVKKNHEPKDFHEQELMECEPEYHFFDFDQP